MTPAVRLSRIVCRLARDASTWLMLWCTAERASDSCCVMSRKARVSPPSSSRPSSAALGVKSPRATWRTPSASTSNGCASWLPSTTANKTAPNTARKRLSVRVPMYILRKPPRASARSWYSRLASCTAMAFATRVVGRFSVICRKRASPSTLTLVLLTTAMALMRGLSSAGFAACTRLPLTAGSPVPFDPAAETSSSPSIWVTTRWLRALRSCCINGRSGCSIKRDSPALAIIWPEAFHSTTSATCNCSRRRSSDRPTLASGVSDSWLAACRVLLASSFARLSSVARPKFRPAANAPSTSTSNQLSIDRDTN